MVTLGTFDGVHLGHRALVERAVAAARAARCPAIGYTFHPHPAKLLAPQAAPATLVPIEERTRLLLELGLDHVIVEPFDAAFAALPAERFVSERLVAQLAPILVVVGFNFSYGRGRGGSPQTLVEAGRLHGFDTEIVSEQRPDGEPVSSSRIRQWLQEGDVRRAQRLLGRPFALTGTVVTGDRRGRLIGFPTANLAPEAEIVPALGVYATRATPIDASGEPAGPSVFGMTNIGRRPTFSGEHVTFETHLFDFDGDLYGRRLRVELIERLRGEQKFAGVEALRAQLELDREAARAALSGIPPTGG